MHLILKRIASGPEATIGILSEVMDNGFHRPMCFTLEDEYRTRKVFGETRIPAGTYDLKYRTVGGHHERYAKKFPAIHEGMLWLQDVPNFKYILIHIGNDDDDTAGCLLTGDTADLQNYTIGRSTAAYKRLYKQITLPCKITIWDADNSAAPSLPDSGNLPSGKRD